MIIIAFFIVPIACAVIMADGVHERDRTDGFHIVYDDEIEDEEE